MDDKLERVEYAKRIMEHATTTFVREQVGGKWGSYSLDKLDEPTRQKWIDRWYAEGRVPVRVIP